MTLRALWQRLGDSQRVIVSNAVSIVGTTGTTSALGAVYWLVAAHQYPRDAVGLAAAGIAAMTFLGTVAVLGFGTLLVGEFPRYKGQEGSVIGTALLTTGLVGIAAGLLFSVVTRFVFKNLQPLTDTPADILLFSGGVGLTTITIVLDQALLGLLRGGLQLTRNVIFGVAKLALLLLAGLALAQRTGMSIYATWVFGNAFSVLAFAVAALVRGGSIGKFVPRWKLLRAMGWGALSHHALNLSLQGLGLILPLVVTAVLSTKLNASFYVAWMIAGFVFIGPRSLTTVLYAAAATAPESLAQKMRFTLWLSLVMGVGASAALFVGADFALRLFGADYAQQAATCLRLLGLGVFPLIIENHYVALSRIQRKVVTASGVMVFTGGVELLLAGIGASRDGLTGISIGWLIGMVVEVAIISPVVYRAAFPSKYTELSARRSTAPPADRAG